MQGVGYGIPHYSDWAAHLLGLLVLSVTLLVESTFTALFSGVINGTNRRIIINSPRRI